MKNHKFSKSVLAVLALSLGSFGSASLQASAEDSTLWNEWRQLTQKEKNEQFGKFAKRCNDKVMLKQAYDQLSPKAKVFRFWKFVQYCSDVEMIWDAWKQLEAAYMSADNMPDEARLPDELKVRVYLKWIREAQEGPDGMSMEQIKQWIRMQSGCRHELLDAFEKLVDVMKF